MKKKKEKWKHTNILGHTFKNINLFNFSLWLHFACRLNNLLSYSMQTFILLAILHGVKMSSTENTSAFNQCYLMKRLGFANE